MQLHSFDKNFDRDGRHIAAYQAHDEMVFLPKSHILHQLLDWFSFKSLFTNIKINLIFMTITHHHDMKHRGMV